MKFIFKHDSTFDKRKIHILINSKYICFLLFSFFNESRSFGNFNAIVFNKSEVRVYLRSGTGQTEPQR